MRIWFNRTYATTAHVIDALRHNPDAVPIRVIGTHADPDSPVLAACDVRDQEPALESSDYVDWALAFAERHAVDVLVPGRWLADLADAREAFAARGTVLVAPEAAEIRRFDNKAAGYAAVAALGLPVPPHLVVGSAADLRDAHAELAAVGTGVCVKPVVGVGGEGFRVLVDGDLPWDALRGEQGPIVSLDAFCAAMPTDPVPRLLVMPLLPGPEVSVDMLATGQGTVLAAIGRGKTRRRRTIVDDPLARAVAERIVTAHRLAYLSNVQVRYAHLRGDAEPRPYLLEVNPRAAGGLYQAASSGVDLTWEAIRLALGHPPRPLRPRFGAAFTVVSSIVPLAT